MLAGDRLSFRRMSLPGKGEGNTHIRQRNKEVEETNGNGLNNTLNGQIGACLGLNDQ